MKTIIKCDNPNCQEHAIFLNQTVYVVQEGSDVAREYRPMWMVGAFKNRVEARTRKLYCSRACAAVSEIQEIGTITNAQIDQAMQTPEADTQVEQTGWWSKVRTLFGF